MNDVPAPPRVVIHIGCDKCGSTSLQYFLGRNDAALRVSRTRVIRHAFLEGGGHPHLFKTVDADAWAKVRGEIDAHRDGIACFVISWEGAQHLNRIDLATIKTALSGFDVRFVFYIREQAALIQSGFLQLVKQDALGQAGFPEFAPDDTRLTPKNRLFTQIIRRFEAVFGKGSVDVRRFEKNRLVGGDVKLDFLHALGIGSPDGFDVTSDRNDSFSVETAHAVLTLDALAPERKDRWALRDTGILLSSQFPGRRWFLSEEQVAQIRAFYASDNDAIAKRFFGGGSLFDLKAVHDPRPVDRIAVAEIARRILEYWPKYPAAQRREKPWRLVAPAGRLYPGWRMRGEQAELVEPRGKVAFRYAARAWMPHHSYGEFFVHTADNARRRLRLWRDGVALDEIKAPKQPQRLPLADLPPGLEVELEIEPIDDRGPLVVDAFRVLMC